MQSVLADSTIHDTLLEVAGAYGNSDEVREQIAGCRHGGSAADAQHLVAELVVRLTVNRPALTAIALTTDTSILTAASNDFGYD